MTVDSPLEARILKAVAASRDPDDLRADLETFLPACTIGVSKRVPTACIRRTRDRYRIEFGRDFLQNELSDDTDLLFVLLHECFHHVLGHLTNSAATTDPRLADAANIAADILVNAAVCRRFFPGGVPLLDRMYRRSDLVGALLRSPSGDARREHLAFTRGLRQGGHSQEIAEQAWQVRYNGWHLEAPFAMLLAEVVDLLRMAGRPTGVVFLGNHEADGEPIPGLPWESDTDCCGAADLDEMEEDELDEPVAPEASPELAAAVRSALVSDPWHHSRRVAVTPVTSPVFSPGRPDWPFLALGHWPTLFHGPRRDTTDDDQRAHVYVDVSGSFDRFAARVYGLLLALADDVGSPVHLFSNAVDDVTLDEMARGVRRTTGGTDFDCVIRHALDRRYRQIVVITDGLGDLEHDLAREFRAWGASLYLVLVETDLDLAKGFSVLPALAKESWVLG